MIIVRISKFLRNSLSFRSKILIMFFIFTFLINIGLGGILYKSSSELLVKQMCNTMSNNLQNTSYNLDENLNTINQEITELSFDTEITHDLQQTPAWESYEYLVLAQAMRETLDRTASNSLLQSIYLVSADFRYFYKSQINRTFFQDELLQTDWAALYPNSIENTWYVLSGKDNIVEKSQDYTLTTVKPIRIFGPSKIVGYVAANISFDKLKAYFDHIKFGNTGHMIVYTSNGQIIYHPDSNLIGQTENTIFPLIDQSQGSDSILRDDALITYHVSDESGLIYAAYIPVQEVTTPSVAIRNVTIVLIAISFCVALLYAVLISRQIFKPIDRLVYHMQKVESGDTSTRITEIRKDEIGILYSSFNAMISQIETLIRRIYHQELLYKELQIKNLQIQLDPHFLYNTLDSIHWAARGNDMNDVCQMTFLLVRFFQSNLSDGRDMVTVREAAAITNNYIQLQKIRFLDKYKFEIHVDPLIEDKKVLKYLFQPLIENALIHGLEQKNEPGICRVSWTIQGDKICFCVEDNGLGIPKDKLLALQNSIEKEDLEIDGNFALRNINLQLRLYYGAQFRLSIDSTYGQGTKVWFYLPIQKEDDECV